MYCYIHTIIMSDIEQLQLLMQKEEERGNELEEQITYERRLLEEAEDQKVTIMRKMLQQQLEAYWNPEKESIYIGRSAWVIGEICSKCEFFSFTLYFWCIFWHFQVFLFIAMSYLYIYIVFWFVSFIFLIFW